MMFQFDSFADFLAMGGYGFYVWLAYGLSILAVGGLLWQSKRESKVLLRQLKKAQQREAQLKHREN